ncbi:Clan CA, family C1, cathepsin L-like cysteine peptidase [Trichomonas vaginalis G3]|uniref:Clan CA, family C1, cathepsin L-like cysteine peptidase n=1 Tax=Trichomonas vaginalis (strain ATCC PRA-98 / G3) TaxID=412133 RepID=A2DKX2_TRIV3|nr:cysteine-type peptidase protein [Trichomonas vaginalis G3]EAY18925.1 Clan CA, family C1, cathepsin L-like cysteine peptidase [Trichomonas vaginalis G3]KAI5531986.1 cysteine-type peptidase protein [Trichomonas vaginalis G3]|eukprot:XP_001579911.1 Clan CA, family C1, cathepsin L-like cysteine peptidase [Trichomonas vaginalis G3]
MFLFSAFVSSTIVSRQEEASFISWMRENSVMFTGEEYAFRLGIYLTTDRYIKQFNRGKRSHTLAHNKFSAYTHAEYKALLNSKPIHPRNVQKSQITTQKVQVPDTWDWRDRVAFNPVRDQMECASGFAFASCACQEVTWNIYYNKLYLLSPQNMLDCAYNEEGCDGGEADRAVGYIVTDQDGKFGLESDYPYKSESMGYCEFDPSKGVTKALAVNYTRDEADMKVRVATTGPLICGYDSSSEDFEYYYQGVYYSDDCSAWGIDHWMTIVGYGTYNGDDYWLVKNSFGKGWGQQGYGMVARNRDGACGVDLLTFSINV